VLFFGSASCDGQIGMFLPGLKHRICTPAMHFLHCSSFDSGRCFGRKVAFSPASIH
jgi:hypothetical protein